MGYTVNNRQQLRKLMFDNNLKAIDVARMLNIAPISVYRYRADPSTVAYFDIPESNLERLKQLLKDKRV